MTFSQVIPAGHYYPCFGSILREGKPGGRPQGSVLHWPRFPGTNVYHVYDNSLINQLSAVHERVLMDRDPCIADVDGYFSVARRLFATMTTRPWSEEEVLTNSTGAQRKKWELAIERRQAGKKMFFLVLMFVKNERMQTKMLGYKPPRPIQFKACQIYNLTFARFTKPLEKRMYDLKGLASLGMLSNPLVAKGKNSWARARIIADVSERLLAGEAKWTLFDDGDDCLVFWAVDGNVVVVGIDCSAWDARVRPELLKLRGRIYEFIFRHASPDMKQALRVIVEDQLRSKVRCMDSDMVYEVLGNIMSGTMDTAVGTVILMVTLVVESVSQAGFDYHVWISTVKSFFMQLGMKLKLESIVTVGSTDDIPKIVFCQSHPLRVGRAHTWRMVTDYRRTIATLLIQRTWPESDKARRRRMAEVALATLSTVGGVPVLQSFVSRLCDITGARNIQDIRDRQLNFRWNLENRSQLEYGVNDLTRLDFMTAYELSPSHQVELEALAASWDLTWRAPQRV